MKNKGIFISTFIGNTLEFYDFCLYGIFVPTFAVLFYPNIGTTQTFLSSLATFGLGFFTRPLGGLFFGYIGDRRGRKAALTLSLSLMALPTFIVSVLPTYNTIGISATFILIACRLLQGICAGGEYTGATIFLVEHLGIKRSGFMGACVTVSGALGSMLAMIVGAFFLKADLSSGVWRIPFFIGGFLSIFGIYFRYKMFETPEFIKNVKEGKVKKNTAKIDWKKDLNPIIATILLSSLVGALAYMLSVYTNLYLQKFVGISSQNSLYVSTIGLLFYVIFCPMAGWISDKVGHIKIMFIGAIGILLTIYPIFVLFQLRSFILLVVLELIFVFFVCLYIAPSSAVMNTLFPVNIRYRAFATAYGIGVAIFGGSLPFISSLLIEVTDNTMIPAYYLMCCTVLSFVGMKIISGRNIEQ